MSWTSDNVFGQSCFCIENGKIKKKKSYVRMLVIAIAIPIHSMENNRNCLCVQLLQYN